MQYKIESATRNAFQIILFTQPSGINADRQKRFAINHNSPGGINRNSTLRWCPMLGIEEVKLVTDKNCLLHSIDQKRINSNFSLRQRTKLNHSTRINHRSPCCLICCFQYDGTGI